MHPNRATFTDMSEMAAFCAELTKLGVAVEVQHAGFSGTYTVTFWSEA